MQGSLAIFKTPQVCVRSPLQEHAAVRVIAFDDGIPQQEAILNVNVGTVVQEDPYATGALTDDGQLQRRGAFIAQRVHLGPELEEEAYERVSTVVGGHVQRCPAIIAFCIYNVTAKLGFQHQSGDACSAMHSSIVKCCEATYKVLHCGVSCTEERGKREGSQIQQELCFKAVAEVPSSLCALASLSHLQN